MSSNWHPSSELRLPSNRRRYTFWDAVWHKKDFALLKSQDRFELRSEPFGASECAACSLETEFGRSRPAKCGHPIDIHKTSIDKSLLDFLRRIQKNTSIALVVAFLRPKIWLEPPGPKNGDFCRCFFFPKIHLEIHSTPQPGHTSRQGPLHALKLHWRNERCRPHEVADWCPDLGPPRFQLLLSL